MHLGKSASVLIAVVTGLGTMTASGQAILKPPFGLSWGDSPEKLVTWAQNHDLNVTITVPGKQPGLSLLRISSDDGFLPDHKATAIEGRFLGGRLYELTVDYSNPGENAEKTLERFEALKRETAREYGKLKPNQQQRKVADQFVTRTESFHREPVRGLFLLLAYTEVEDLLRETKSGRFSLIYRNDNYRKELEAAMAKP